jgi:hypothetical protein
MNLDPKTIKVMKHMANIYEGLLIRPGNTLATLSKTRAVYLEAVVPQSFESEIGIGDLQRFFGVYNLFGDDVEMVVDQKAITLRAGKKKLQYTLSRPDCIDAPPAGKKPVLASEDLEVFIPQNYLIDVMKAAGALGMPEIAICSKDDKLTLETYNGRNPTSDNFSLELGDALTKDFKLAFRVENVKMIPADYRVVLSFKKRSKWYGTIFDDVEAMYMVSAEDTSRV